MLLSLYRRFLTYRVVKEFKKKVTLLGTEYEFTKDCYACLTWGAKRDNIIIKDDVSILGASLNCSHKGKITIGNHVKMQRFIKILCTDSIEIGDYTAIAPNVVITDNNNHPINPEFRKYMRTTPHGSDARSMIHADHAPIKIGQNCWIGQNVRIQKGVTIGDNSIIAANSVVTKSVPANCIAAGNPARVVKTDIDQIPAPTSCEEFNNYMKSRK